MRHDINSLEVLNSGTRFDILVEPDITPAACAAASNGAISLNVSGGTPPFTYNWSTGATTASLTACKQVYIR